MKVRWERAPRVPRPPAWAVGLVAGWLLLVLGGVLLERQGAPELETCLFHRLTAHPCPTCGSTRVVLAVTRGAWRAALGANPLVAAGLALGGLLLSVRLATGWTPRLEATARERSLLLAAGLAVLLANWAWVWRTQA